MAYTCISPEKQFNKFALVFSAKRMSKTTSKEEVFTSNTEVRHV